MTRVKTSPCHPQSNVKIERYHRTIKGDYIRLTTLWASADARKAVIDYVKHYNEVRLHSAINYINPLTKFAGKEKEVFADRDAKLKAAREQRRLRRAAARQNVA